MPGHISKLHHTHPSRRLSPALEHKDDELVSMPPLSLHLLGHQQKSCCLMRSSGCAVMLAAAPAKCSTWLLCGISSPADDDLTRLVISAQEPTACMKHIPAWDKHTQMRCILESSNEPLPHYCILQQHASAQAPAGSVPADCGCMWCAESMHFNLNLRRSTICCLRLAQSHV
jgi:hypothetical protein